MRDAMSSGSNESKALLAVRVTALVPLLWLFLVGGALRKAVGKDWVPVEVYIWPVMIAPVVLTAAYVKYRRVIQCAPKVLSLFRVAAGLFIIVNGAMVLYSWIAVIPAALCVGILLDSLINRSAEEAP
ncbi:hypothetical protein [Streptomyces hygroscopicus]|uniref:hypothetical protein n=1 Tax=Streptomyces hygroscopicus TaxID=1912 RepID=UPI001FCB0F70|nr:hypothetical protein [Streptomyces hygroscopicus]